MIYKTCETCECSHIKVHHKWENCVDFCIQNIGEIIKCVVIQYLDRKEGDTK